MARIIERAVEGGRSASAGRSPFLARFERSRLTSELAVLFDRVLEVERSVDDDRAGSIAPANSVAG
jgi:hypothetical protein